MSDGRRPGGLMALAVLNFVFAGFGLLGLLALLVVMGSVEQVAKLELSRATILLLIALAALVATLQIVSGVGYLGMKRVAGRYIGTTYAILALAGAAVGIGTQGFKLMNLIDLVYPVLTLVLLNTTFKDDLVN